MSQPPDPRPVVLVTGSAQRIGREIALELAAHRWQVAVHYRRSAAAAEHTFAAVSQAGRQVSDRDLTRLVQHRPLGRDLRMDLGHVERLDGVDDLLE